MAFLAGRSDRSRSSARGSSGKEAGDAVKAKIARALQLYKAAVGECGGALVQVWAPARDGDRRLLATRRQPFVLPTHCNRLIQYRAVSLTHAFAVGGAGAAGERGLPGRVFDARAPEWTPNVQYYGGGEYARIRYALIYDIQATLALPIFDPDTGSCVAVLELVTTSPRLCFSAEFDKLCKALQAVALRGSDICRSAAEIYNDEAAQIAMPEVSKILTTVCEAHRLPLAQAWVRCKRCNSSSTSTAASLTAAGAPFHLADAGVGGFREACVEHHLRNGQGLVGEAAAARRPRFCHDVARYYSKDAYPLAHHARFCSLAGCFAVYVQLRRDADMSLEGHSRDECVLEFFLQRDRRDGAAQRATVDAIVATITQRFGNGNLSATTVRGLHDLPLEIAEDGDCVPLSDRVTVTKDGDASVLDCSHRADHMNSDEDVHLKKKMGRGKAQKSVSVEELQRYFSGSLKDYARSLGVCPRMKKKRICRLDGISRWPFGKINKANGPDDKINRLIESEQSSTKPTVASFSQQAPAPAAARSPPPHPMPCISSGIEVSSSQGSCQEPPPPTNTTLRKPLRGGGARVVTVKASYRGDIIRFRVPCSASVTVVKGEVTKRLPLEAGAFDLKYLDDDSEWVLISCDADLHKCLDVVLPTLSEVAASSPGAAHRVVRLMVMEVADDLGSSC